MQSRGTVVGTIPMPSKAFIPQADLSAWVSAERVDLRGDTLVLRGASAALSLMPASHFRTLTAGDDTHSLLGKVKDERALEAMGAEGFETSVILGETAYEVDPGFVATVVLLGGGDEGQIEGEVLAALQDLAATG